MNKKKNCFDPQNYEDGTRHIRYSFIFWVLQYSGCVEVLDTGKKGKDSYRDQIKETLKKALEKYEEDESCE